jgi:hypothetical protein
MDKIKLAHHLKLHKTNYGKHWKQGDLYITQWCDKCSFFREVKVKI